MQQVAAMAQGPADTLRIILADDHEIVRAGLRKLVESLPGTQVVAEASDGLELLRELEGATVDMVLTDITMPGMDGVTAIQQIRTLHPLVQVLVLSMHDDANIVRRAFAAGACGYLSKNAPEFELGQALRSVKRKGMYVSPSITYRLLQPAEPSAMEKLTARQVQIVTLLAKGMATKEIGFQLGLSARTVDVHRSRIMQRLQFDDFASLVRYAVRKGLVSP